MPLKGWSGEAKYASDIYLPGMLYVKILRSPHPHAKVVKIDTAKAQALPGVKAILTPQDVPDFAVAKGDSPLRPNAYPCDDSPLCRRRNPRRGSRGRRDSGKCAGSDQRGLPNPSLCSRCGGGSQARGPENLSRRECGSGPGRYPEPG